LTADTLISLFDPEASISHWCKVWWAVCFKIVNSKMLHVYKSRLYWLDGQQDRLNLYHVQLNHPRWSALTWENWFNSCNVRLNHPL